MCGTKVEIIPGMEHLGIGEGSISPKHVVAMKYEWGGSQRGAFRKEKRAIIAGSATNKCPPYSHGTHAALKSCVLVFGSPIPLAFDGVLSFFFFYGLCF